MSAINNDIFTWDDSVSTSDRVFVMGDNLSLFVDRDGYLSVSNYKSGKEGILKKEWIRHCAFSRPKLFFKGGFTIIWNVEAAEALSDVLEIRGDTDNFFGESFIVNGMNKIMGFSVEPPKSEKDLFKDIEEMVCILKHNGVKFV